MIVADTDVLIDALAGREAASARVDEELERGRLATTSVTAFELLSGAGSAGTRRKVEHLLAPLSLLPFDDRAADAAAEARRELESQGIPIGMADYLIAGICLSRSTALLTRNRDHFSRIPGLELGEL